MPQPSTAHDAFAEILQQCAVTSSATCCLAYANKSSHLSKITVTSSSELIVRQDLDRQQGRPKTMKQQAADGSVLVSRAVATASDGR